MTQKTGPQASTAEKMIKDRRIWLFVGSEALDGYVSDLSVYSLDLSIGSEYPIEGVLAGISIISSADDMEYPRFPLSGNEFSYINKILPVLCLF